MEIALELYKEFKDRPKVRKAKIACRNHPLSAPRSEKDVNDGTSVETAVKTWCRDNNKSKVGSNGFNSRWGITQMSVPDRSSIWLRVARTCNSGDRFNQQECEKALMDGMQQCDKGPETHGLATSIDCLDYSIDFSGLVDKNNPPWAEKEEDRKFPPPEFAEKKGGRGQAHTPLCDPSPGQRPLTDYDLNRAIDAFCQNGQEIKGYGEYWANMFDYPPENEAQFYSHEGYSMHLTLGAQTVNNGDKDPYEDMRWCK